MSSPPITPNQLAWTDRALRALRGTGLTEADKAGVVLLVTGHLTAARMRTELGAAIKAGAFDHPEGTAEPDREFGYTFGLDRILDGVAALIRKRATAAVDR
ncbi:hypothetical protein ACPZ19_33800 [Amycolatopsis lurida]